MSTPTSDPSAAAARAPEPRYPYVHVDVRADQSELVALELWELGAQGVEERDAKTFARPAQAGLVTLVGSFPTEADAEQAVSALGDRYPARTAFVVGDAWRDGWRAHFKPTRVGQHLVIRPSWEPFAPQEKDVVITLDPGGAFGTGTHESTRLVLSLLEGLVTTEPVLDVGCGSGILSIAALLLGAEAALAIDIDGPSVATTRENAQVNGVADRLTASDRPLADIEGAYGLVLANIEAHILIPLSDALTQRVQPAGVLIMSGILNHQVSDVLAAFPRFRCEARPSDGDWTALQLRRD